MKTANNSLSLITESGILNQKDLDFLVSHKHEFEEDFLRVQTFRTPCEMRISVLNDVTHPTADSKYWQAIRESNVFYTELVNASYEYRKKKVEIKMLERELNTEQDELEKEMKEIEIEQAYWSLMNQEKTAKARIDELNEWSVIKKELEQELNFSKQNVNDHQLLSYAAKFIQQNAISGDFTPNELQNLTGHLTSTFKEIKRQGLMQKFLDSYGEGAEEVKLYLKDIKLLD